MGKTLSFRALGAATDKANAAEQGKADKASKRKAPPPPVEADEDDSEETDEEDEDEAPPARVSKRTAKVAKKKTSKRAPVEDTDEEDDADTGDSEDEAPAPAPSARESFNAATAAPDHILQFFKPGAGLKGEAKIVTQALGELADYLATNLPRNPQRAKCLDALLVARDCAVRAVESEGA